MTYFVQHLCADGGWSFLHTYTKRWNTKDYRRAVAKARWLAVDSTFVRVLNSVNVVVHVESYG